MTSKVFSIPCPSCNSERVFSCYASWHLARKTHTVCKVCSSKSRNLASAKKWIDSILPLHSAGMTNRAIAKELGVHYSTISNWLRANGKTSSGFTGSIDLVSDNEARCKKCNEVKNLDKFTFNRRGGQYEYRLGTCNSCRHSRHYELSVSSIESYLHRKWMSTRKSSRAIRCGFSITEDDFVRQYFSQNGLCFYTDVPMHYNRRGRSLDNSSSVDKIIPGNGYSLGNVVFCCARINTMKSNMTIDEMRVWTPDWHRRIVKWRELGLTCFQVAPGDF